MNLIVWLRQHRRGIIITVIVIAIILVALLWFLRSLYVAQDVVLTTPQDLDSGHREATSTSIIAPVGGRAEVTARLFAERFGSYSNQNPYDNIRQLFSLMTEQLRSSFTDQPSTPAADYQGVESRAVAVKIVSSTETTSQIVVTLQRSERDKSLQTTVYYQGLELSLIKKNDQWLVSAARWLTKQ